MTNPTEDEVRSYYAEDRLLSSLSVYNVGSQKCRSEEHTSELQSHAY